MKKWANLLLVLTSSMALAAGGGEEEGGKAHHDWNKVSPQPVADTSKSVQPTSTKLVSPNFLQKIKGTETTLKWDEVSGTEYYLQVATDAMFKWIIVDQPNMKVTEYNVKGLEAGKQYFWRVYTQKPGNWAGYTKGNAVKSSFEVVQ